MIETECFDDLNVFFNPDDTLVANLNDKMPPLEESREKGSSCCSFLLKALRLPTATFSDSSGARGGSGGGSVSASASVRHREPLLSKNRNNALTESSSGTNDIGCHASATIEDAPAVVTDSGAEKDTCLEDAINDPTGELLLNLAVLRSLVVLKVETQAPLPPSSTGFGSWDNPSASGSELATDIPDPHAT